MLRCYRVSFDKITRMVPAFRPQWTARMGAQELYDAYREVGLTVTDIEQGRYVRISEIRRQQSADGSTANCIGRQYAAALSA